MLRAAAVAAAVLLAGCSGSDVTTDSAVDVGAGRTAPPASPAPASSTRPTAAAPGTSSLPATTAPGTSTTPVTRAPGTWNGSVASTEPPATTAPTPDPDQPSLSVGDRLYPGIGSADLDVRSYDLRLRYDPPAERLDATVTITTTVDRPLDVIALDARQLVVDGVSIDGRKATFRKTPSELLVEAPARLLPGAPVAVAVTFHDERHGSVDDRMGAGWYPATGGSYVLDEPDGARNWLPSNDTPSDKATWRFEITVPAGLTAVANGHLVARRPGRSGTTWVWEEPAP